MRNKKAKEQGVADRRIAEGGVDEHQWTGLDRQTDRQTSWQVNRQTGMEGWMEEQRDVQQKTREKVNSGQGKWRTGF